MQCGDYGAGWQGEYPNCTYAPSDHSGLNEGSLGFGEELAGSKFENDWEKYFDAYDPTKETMLTQHADIDIGQLGAAWDLESQQLGTAWGLQSQQLGEAWGLQSQQLGEGYQQQLGGLFEQAGTGMMSLMDSWAGAGQAMSGRKGRQRKALGRETARQAGAYGLSLRQARDTGALGLSQARATGDLALSQAMATGALGLQQDTTDIYQGLESDIYGARDSWEKEQRSNLNTLLGMDIWEGDDDGDDGDDDPPPPLTCDQQGKQTCPDGSCIEFDSPCGADPNACGTGKIRCADGSCQWLDDSPGNPCDNYGGEEGDDDDCEPPVGGCSPTEFWNQNTCTCEWIA